MRSLLARLAVLGAFALCASACSGGNGTALPFAGPPNNAGGSGGTFQAGGTGGALVRFVQGSPDFGLVDVCIDNLQFSGGALPPTVGYGKALGGANAAQSTLVSVTAGIGHTISVYPSLGSTAGAQCPTAPGPFILNSAIAVTTISPAVNTRTTVVLGGTAVAKTLGLYAFQDPTFPIVPTTASAYWHNAAPTFTAALPGAKSVGFGYNPTAAGPPTNVTGATSVPAGAKSPVGAAVVNAQAAQSALPGAPVSFFDGAGVLAGSVVPITTVATPALAAGQAPVYGLIAIDAPAGGLGLVVVPEQTNSFGF